VALAEDLPLLREGISAVLRQAGCEVLVSVGDAEELLEALETTDVDLVVTDVRMPPTFTDEGLSAVKAMREKRPDLGVVVLSQYTSVAYLPEILDQSAGAGLAYLLKERVGHVDTFLGAIRGVLGGATIIDPEIVTTLMKRSHGDDDLAQLTPRELEVLELMAQGQTNGVIAENLVVTEAAVRKHVGNIFAKLPMEDRTDRRVAAVLAFLRREG
jgi:DNA-binding NarL/FixJ family response regulator